MPEGAEVRAEHRPMTVAELVRRLCELPLDAPVAVSFNRVDDDGEHWAEGFDIIGIIYHEEDGWVGIDHGVSGCAEWEE